MKVLIVGGYGVFGGRLARLLCDIPDLCLLICGRNLATAQEFCAGLESTAELIPVKVDRNSMDATLQEYTPEILVDASGPFQEYGADPYRLVKNCIARGVNYLDFADGSDFVYGIHQYDRAAKDAGIFVLSGVSSFPVLTAAVIREFEKDIDVTKVIGGIAPSPYAGIGMNVMRAVLGYAGGPVALLRDGQSVEVGGLTESLRYTISPPGHLPLRNLHFSLVDVPDLKVIPREFNGITDIWIGAGPVPEILHRVLNGLAKVRSRFSLPSFAPLASLCYWVLNHMRFGEDRGGMFVEVTGKRDQQSVKRSWHLLAEGEDGPYIPSMAIEIIIRKLLDGVRPAEGARPAIHEINLADYDRVFSGRQIVTGVRQRANEHASLFAQVLERSMPELPESVVDFHSVAGDSVWEGKAKVTAASNVLAKFVARIFGFPTTGGSSPVRVAVKRNSDREEWHRQFGRFAFRSVLTAGRGVDKHLICERFGLITVSLAIVWNDGKLFFIPRRWRLGPLPLPKFLLPKGETFESDDNGQFAFNVTLAAPILGRIASYKGTLSRTFTKNV